MSAGCDRFCADVDRFFGARVAARDLRRYQRKGPGVTTRLLRDGVRAHAPGAGTLLDVGAGVAPLTFELMAAGVGRATVVDASSAFLAAAREEAQRRQQEGRIDWLHGDFAVLADTLPDADIVTLDRVVCCYPAFDRLLGAAARRARTCLGFSYPRDRSFIRAALAAQNAVRRLLGSAFRVFVHPPAAMDELVRRNGFTLASRETTLVWCADIYVRTERI